MNLMMSLAEITERCIDEHAQLKSANTAAGFFVSEKVGDDAENLLALGDNKEFMHWLIKNKEMEGKFNFIYLDPPFFSGSNYHAEVKVVSKKLKLGNVKTKAYNDTWQNGMEDFLGMLTQRLLLMKDLLAQDGAIVLHMDWHAVHYAKIIMDEIFGEKNFVNEIIWNYKSGGVSGRSFAKKHDTLLYYAKSRQYYFNPQKEKSYNRGYNPYRFKGVKEFKDDTGWYTMVNKRDVFNLDMVGRTSCERTGYATQKPEKLMEILLESCTREGDLCGDFFAGSGTLPAVAKRMGRRFIACDNSPLAVATTRKRLYFQDAAFSCMESSQGKKSDQALIEADLRIQETVSDEFLCSATLSSYQCNIDNLPVDKEMMLSLKNLQASDPLALVDYWCVDNHYNGKSFQTKELILKKDLDLSSVATFLVKPGSVVAIKVYDVFGGCAIFTQSV